MLHEDIEAPGETFNFAAYLIELNRQRGDKIAYIDDDSQLSYGELTEGIRRMAAVLLENGLRREERVLILMHDCNDWPLAFLGALYAGIVPVAINTLLTAEDYAFILKNSRARTVLVSQALLDTLQQAIELGANNVETIFVSHARPDLPAPCLPLTACLQQAAASPCAAVTHRDEPAFWLYSSGSTGNPKGTVHSQANLFWTARLYGQATLGIVETDTCFSAAKLFFAYGLGNALSFPLSVGATVVLMAGRPTPDAVFERWINHQPSVFFGAPTGYAAMLADPQLPVRNSVALRLASSAGEPLPADLGERFSAHFGADIIDGIGSTEMLHIYLSNLPTKVLYGTTGYPVPGYTIELRSDDGQRVKDGEIGDLYVQGPSAALCYWNNRDKSRETFQGVWTKSGDKYIRNSDGSYTYSGRSDDMLKVSGIYVSPFEVEATLAQHEAVLEAAVVGKADADGLTKSQAFVVLKPGQQVSAEDLTLFVKDRLAAYKYPRFIEFIDELPKTATGKIQRFRLRQAQSPDKA